MLESKMRMCVSQFQVFDDEMATFAKQLGFDEIQMNTPVMPGDGKWTYENMRALKEGIENHGLRMAMIENVPLPFYDKVILCLPGRDEQLENYLNIIENIGKLEIPLFGHHFSPTFVWRTNTEALGRGGAQATEYDQDNFVFDANAFDELMKRKKHKLDYDVFEVADGLTQDTLFENYAYFMKAVMPQAEKWGVKIALHPDDPPVLNFRNIQRLITCKADYLRAMKAANSPNWGVNLCLGCCSELGGDAAVKDMIHTFGEMGKLFAVHFRDVKGVLPHFIECFLGEGNFDPPEILRELVKTGFDGLIMEDHVNKLTYDTIYGHRARAHELGYIKGMLEMMRYYETNLYKD